MFLADIVEPAIEKDESLRDASDRPVLGTLLTSQANYLITGDQDILALAAHYPILTPAEYIPRDLENDTTEMLEMAGGIPSVSHPVVKPRDPRSTAGPVGVLAKDAFRV
jgi:hypothetical protein